MCYFYLVRTFNAVPIHLKAYESDKQEVNIAPSSEVQVLDVIEEDLKVALEKTAESYSSVQENCGRVTKKAIRAIWADLKLWREDYVGCLNLCEELEKEYAGKIVKGDNWFSIFGEGNSSESIFEYQFSNDGVGSPLPGFLSYFYTSLGSGDFAGNYRSYRKNMQKVYSASGMQEYSDTVRTSGATLGIISNGKMDVYKYQGIVAGYKEFVYRDAITKEDAHFIFYRFREILLIKAEALAMQDHYDQAIQPINEIRRATGLVETTVARFGSGENFFDKLLSERCAELAFEGKQWYSMVRLVRHTGFRSLIIDRVADTHLDLLPTVVKSRLQDEDGWFMPYLKSEVERNHALEQKTYYKGKD
ncbi:MAG: RagB/SusD family nutrient uptake outer membrane protein [Odoribacter sp.]